MFDNPSQNPQQRTGQHGPLPGAQDQNATGGNAAPTPPSPAVGSPAAPVASAPQQPSSPPAPPKKEPEDIFAGTDQGETAPVSPPQPTPMSAQAPQQSQQGGATPPWQAGRSPQLEKPRQFQPKEPGTAKAPSAGSTTNRRYVLIGVVVIVVLIVVLIAMVVLAYLQSQESDAPTANQNQETGAAPANQEAATGGEGDAMETQDTPTATNTPGLPSDTEMDTQPEAMETTDTTEATTTTGTGTFDDITDTDNDGLTNTEEAQLGTNPTSADTDGDGLSDREEIRVYRTDPLDSDTDGDGYGDGEEVNNGYNPNGPGALHDLP